MSNPALAPAPLPTAGDAGRGPRWLRGTVVAQPGYLYYLVAMLFGGTGFWVARIAQDWLLLQLTNNVATVGIASSLQFAPLLIFGLWGGAIADRFNVRNLVMIAQATIGLSSATLGVLALTGNIKPWHVFVSAGVIGMAQVLEQPSRASLISQLSGVKLGQALSLNSIAFQATAFWGPALATIIIATVGTGYAFLTNAVGGFMTVLLYTRIKTVRKPSRVQSAGTIRDGLRAIRETSQIAWTIVLIGVLSVNLFNMPLIYADMANKVFSTGVSGYSWYNTIAALGAIGGALIAGWRRDPIRVRSLAVNLFAMGGMAMITAWSPNSLVFSGLIFGLAVLFMMQMLYSSGLVQLTADPSARGRIMSVYSIVFLGGQALSAPLLGRVIDTIGSRATLTINGAIVMVGAVVVSVLIGRSTRQKLIWFDRRLRITERRSQAQP